jgi:predicted flavoprotein YhiN
VRLSEVNFKTIESRLCPRLYFGGELLDIDGLTGGFNFQGGLDHRLDCGPGHDGPAPLTPFICERRSSK